MIPVYIVNGFLDSGKTDFLRYTIDQPYFKTKGKTLLIVCEEGENEYSEDLLKRNNTIMEHVLDESELTPVNLTIFEKKYDPERVIIEYNGMWNYKEFTLPANWAIEQQITTIDCSSFKLYFTNMKSLLAEQIRNSDLILFNRCDGNDELASYKRNVKAINQKADIVFEDENGEVDVTLDEDLPYDLKADVIELDSNGFGMFYIDALDHLDRYIGKKVRFDAMVCKPAEFTGNIFVPGRMVMTCCAQDIQLMGYACEYDKTDDLKPKSWINLTAEVTKKFMDAYEGEGPVLKALEVKEIPAPPKDKQIIDFSNPN